MKITQRLCIRIIKRDKILGTTILFCRDAPYQPENDESFIPYYEGRGDPELSIHELDFQCLKGWIVRILLTLKRDVPFGNVITYGELARITGIHPRAVGLAMKLNPFPLIIPCHRVIGRKGIGGYSMGIEIKRELLKHEGIIL